MFLLRSTKFSINDANLTLILDALLQLLHFFVTLCSIDSGYL